MRFRILFGFLFFVSLLTVFAQDGQIDSSFGVNGRFVHSGHFYGELANSIVTLRDGSFVFSVLHNNYSRPAYGKITNTGQADSSFGENGLLSLFGEWARANFVTLQSSDRIIIAYSDDLSIIVSRYSSTGNIDSSFGVNGRARILFPQQSPVLKSIVVDKSDRIVICTSLKISNNPSIGISRLNKDGIIDQSFGDVGHLIHSAPGFSLTPNDMELAEDYGILITGSGVLRSANRSYFYTLKLLESGNPDNSFGTGGVVKYSHTGNSTATVVKVQPDGKVLVGGYFITQPYERGPFMMIRYLPSGEPDTQFGKSGLVLTDFSGNSDVLNDLIILQDGKIVAGGISLVRSGAFFVKTRALARYLPDGRTDSNFGRDGILPLQVFTKDEQIMTLALQSDMKLIVAGSGVQNNTSLPAVYRYLTGASQLSITNIPVNQFMTVGSNQPINWSAGTASFVRLEFSSDGGSVWSVIPGAEMLPASDESFLWRVPNTPSDLCFIKIVEAANPSSFFQSHSFRIVAPAILIPVPEDTCWLDSDLDGYATNTLDASHASIENTEITGYRWYLNGELVDTNQAAVFTLTTGSHEITLVLLNDMAIGVSKQIRVMVVGSNHRFGQSITAPVSQLGNTYYLSSFNSKLFRIDSSGNILNTYITRGRNHSAFSISRTDNVYISADNRMTYRFDAGLLLNWELLVGDNVKATPVVDDQDSSLYLVTANGVVQVLRGTHGNFRWSYNTERPVTATPLLVKSQDETLLLVGTQMGPGKPPLLLALKDSGAGGTMLWSKVVSGGIQGGLAFRTQGSQSMVYFATGDGYLYRVKWDGHSEDDWKVNLGSPVNNASPVIDSAGIIYVGTSAGYLLGFDPFFTSISQPVRQFFAGSEIATTPAIGRDGKLYFGTKGGRFFALKHAGDSLDIHWSLKTGVPFYSPALVSESGLVMNGSGNGVLYVMRNPDYQQSAQSHNLPQWPTFAGNNKRNRIAYLDPTSVDDGNDIPLDFTLQQNYPNPFNPVTEISYSLPVQTFVQLHVFDILGNKVETLVSNQQQPGHYTVQFHSKGLSSGVYFYQMKTTHFSAVKKMVVLK